MQSNEDALYDYLAGDVELLLLLEGPAAERILAVRPPLVEIFPSITFDTAAAPAFSDSNPIDDSTIVLDIATRTRHAMNAIAARIVDQLDIIRCRRPSQRELTITGRRIKYQGFTDRAGTNSYEPTPRDVFHKVLSFRLITTSA